MWKGPHDTGMASRGQGVLIIERRIPHPHEHFAVGQLVEAELLDAAANLALVVFSDDIGRKGVDSHGKASGRRVQSVDRKRRVARPEPMNLADDRTSWQFPLAGDRSRRRPIRGFVDSFRRRELEFLAVGGVSDGDPHPRRRFIADGVASYRQKSTTFPNI